MNEDTWFGRAMNMTRPNESATRNRSIAVSALYWFELKALELDYRRLKQSNPSKVDSWWASTGGEAQGPCRFIDILKLVLNGAGTVAAVPESSAHEDPTPWKTIAYKAWWSNPRTAWIWTIGFWLTAIFFGWAFVCAITPFAFQRPAEISYCLLIVCAAIRTTRLRARPRR